MSTATQRCEFCGSPAHVWFACTDPKRKPDWRPDRLTKSTAGEAQRSASQSGASGGAAVQLSGPLVSDKPAVDTPKRKRAAKAKAEADAIIKRGRGRPASGVDKKALKREQMRRYRAKQKGKP